MERPNYLKQIKERVENLEKGSVIIPSDFFDIIDAVKVNVSLTRLVEDKTIRRIMRGVYEYPKYNDFLGEFVASDPNKVAHALARNYGWSIAPSGDTALNMLGLSTQVPSIWDYISDGPYKEYGYDKVTIKFKHRTNKEISGLSPKTALVIQAIKTLGKDHIDNNTIRKITDILFEEEKDILLQETQQSTAWVYEIIKKICRKASY